MEMPRLLKAMVHLLKEHKGSDLHMLEGEPPRIRVRGDLRPIEIKDHPHVTAEDIQAILDIALTPDQKLQLEQKGDVDFSLSFEGASGRVNVGFANGRKLHLTMRYLPEQIIPLEKLGIDAEMLKQLAGNEAGLIIVAGETSSGKTTTIAAMLDYINHTRMGSITTIENPVEYVLKGDKCLITRREIGRDTPSFHDALRASVRKNPDVLLIGEIRDRETGQIALTAAETGILTFCTLHAVGAIAAITRLAHIMAGEGFKEEEFLLRLSHTLLGIIAQQLVKAVNGQYFLPLYEILNITDIERGYMRAGKFDRLEQSLESERSISLGECIYRLWQQRPRPIDEALVRRIYGSQFNQAMNVLNDPSGYKPINRWMA
ncbi:MAG: type IV pilus twitching motility protein PilT [Candidatus Sumerlaeia bacterium]